MNERNDPRYRLGFNPTSRLPPGLKRDYYETPVCETCMHPAGFTRYGEVYKRCSCPDPGGEQ